MDAKIYSNFIQSIQLREINLNQAVTKKYWDKLDLPEEPNFEISSKVKSVAQEGNVLRICSRFQVHGTVGDSEKFISILFEFELIYDLSSMDSATIESSDWDELLELFVNRNVPLNIWPYAREFISSSMVRMGFPPLLIGLFRPDPQ